MRRLAMQMLAASMTIGHATGASLVDAEGGDEYMPVKNPRTYSKPATVPENPSRQVRRAMERDARKHCSVIVPGKSSDEGVNE